LLVIDDAQWLDQASALTLGFVARRLGAEPVGLLFAARDPGNELRELPQLDVRGLGTRDARALLRSVVRFMLDERVSDQIVAETRGNPLALLELPRGLTRPSWRVGSDCLARRGCPDGSRRVSASGLRSCRLRPRACCWWQRRNRSEIHCSCGARRNDSESESPGRLPTCLTGC
jgi:hypothetical protein